MLGLADAANTPTWAESLGGNSRKLIVQKILLCYQTLKQSTPPTTFRSVFEVKCDHRWSVELILKFDSKNFHSAIFGDALIFLFF